MNITEAITTAKDSITVKRVYGEPYEKDGLTVIPAAAVSGGAGGGSGTDQQGQQGEGAGFGTSARPVGAFTIKSGEVHWRPAVDPNHHHDRAGHHRLPADPRTAYAFLSRGHRQPGPVGTATQAHHGRAPQRVILPG